MNFDPDVDGILRDPRVLAGDRFKHAMPDMSTLNDSFELQDEELGTDDNGSNINDFLYDGNKFRAIRNWGI